MSRRSFSSDARARAPFVSFHALTVVHPGMGRPVLDDVELRFEAGVTAIVGANGAGKSTLLRVVTGEVAPSSGWVTISNGASVVAVPADAPDVAPEVRAFATADDGASRALRGRLGIEADMLDRWRTLSAGERRRWQLGAALAAAPEVLLLDEPDGHLDAESRALVVATLSRFRGATLLVTHDRALTDAVASGIVRVHEGRARRYPVPYAAARDAWEAERAEALEHHARARATERALASRLDEARRAAESARRGVSSRTRMKGPRDADARGSLAKGLARRAEARTGRSVHVVRAAHERASDAVPEVTRDVTLGRDVFVRARPSPSPVAVHLEAARIGPPMSPILRDVTLTITRDDRVRIHGPNGAGKSTLVRALVEAAPVRERVGHLPQELATADVEELVLRLHALRAEERSHALSIVAALGVDPARLARRDVVASTLSSGEAKKLALSLLLASEVSVLVLDEPTNHLDLASVERLERALDGFPGALVVVTHDDAFAEVCTQRVVDVLRFRDHLTRRVPGTAHA